MTEEAVSLERRSATAGLVDRLLEIQRRTQDNYIPQEEISHIARDLRVSIGFVQGVASFYSMLSDRPRGRHVIRVCQSPNCQISGRNKIVRALEKVLEVGLGETTSDGEFTLESSSCLGGCSNPPVMQVDDALYTAVDPENIPDILSKVRGEKKDSPRHDLPNMLGKRHLLKSCGHVKLTDAQNAGIYEGLKKAVKDMTPQEVTAAVNDAGLRGRGGAGFPTGRKWEFTRNASAEKKYLVCNADEGEPGTFKDRLLLEGCPHLVIEGMVLSGYAVGASKGFIYIRGEYAEAILRMEKALSEARASNYLGHNILGSSYSFDIEVHKGAGAYVCGEETSLIESMEGKRGFPRLRPPYPASAGLFGQPTAINNVETLANVPAIVLGGSVAYRSLGVGSASGTKLYPLSGAVANTGVVEAPLGTTLRELIHDVGGGVSNGKRFLAALVGGAAGVFLGEDMLEVPLDYDSLASHGATLGAGAVLVLDNDCNPASLILDILRFFRHESCGQCTPCRVGTARLVEMMEDLIATEGKTDVILTHMLETALLMQNTSLCPLGQSPYPMLRSAANYFGHYLGTDTRGDL
jgi:NADH:ubiquinone oxidoreductase subunit F (NADH-binding)/NADH:ubiquinone oxidoreductase subunit E